MAGLGVDMVRMVRRNKLVGFWAAEKLALAGENAKTYSDGLAMAAMDAERSNILVIIRRDFDAAGVILSDEDILAVMNVCWLEAGKQTKGPTAAMQRWCTLRVTSCNDRDARIVSVPALSLSMRCRRLRSTAWYRAPAPCWETAISPKRPGATPSQPEQLTCLIARSAVFWHACAPGEPTQSLIFRLGDLRR